MKIAIPVADDRLCMHFGHCEQFVFIEVDGDRQIAGTSSMVPPPHEPGVLPRWLSGLGVNLVIAGGMGARARQLFDEHGIEVVVGAPAEHPRTIALAWLRGTLNTGENVCDH